MTVKKLRKAKSGGNNEEDWGIRSEVSFPGTLEDHNLQVSLQ